jgi:hypothetical protein
MRHGSGEASAVALPPLRTLNGLRGLLENKVGIVTGASHGIGEAAAMVEAGAKVALAARNRRLILRPDFNSDSARRLH